MSPGLDRRDVGADVENLDDAGVADDDLVLFALLADVDRRAVERVAHVAFPASVERFDEDFLARDRVEREILETKLRPSRIVTFTRMKNPSFRRVAHP